MANFIFLLALIYTPGPVAARSGQAVAFVELIAPANRKLEQVARIFRHNRKIPGQKVAANGLEPGDLVFITDADSVIFVRFFATNRLVALRRNLETQKGAPDWVVIAPAIQPPPTIFSRLLAEAMRIASGKRASSMIEPMPNTDNYVIAATRSVTTGPVETICPNSTGLTNEPVRFRAAALNSFENRIAAGQRALFVQWRGGIEPYSLELSNSMHKSIAEMHGLRNSCSAILPMATLADGNLLSLTLQDGHNVRAVIPQIEIVKNLPAMPSALAMAKLPAEARTLYYATWLTTQDDGVWTFEAVQMVNGLGCAVPAALEWISRYGNSPCIKAVAPADTVH